MSRGHRLELEDQLPRAPDRYWFPHHTQEHGMSCAPACARMIAEWLTKKLWLEKDVAKAIGWNGSFRPSYPQRRKLNDFVRRVSGTGRWAWCHSSVEGRDAGNEAMLRDDLAIDPKKKRPKMRVAMLLVAAYRCNARLAQTPMIPVNVGHWLIARSIRRVSAELDSEVRAKTPGTPMLDLALVNDPAFAEPYFETWDSLCGRVIDSAFVVERR